MKNKRFFVPRVLLPMGAVILLGLALLSYYFWFLGRREASADRRAFRNLAAVSVQFRDRVTNYQTVLGRAVSLAQVQTKAATKKSSNTAERVKGKHENRNPESTRVSKTTSPKTAGNSESQPLIQSRDNPQRKAPDAQAQSAIADFLNRQVPDLRLASECSIADKSVGTVLTGGSYALRLSLGGRCADAGIDAAIAPLLKESSKIFDDILLTDADGRVLFQNGGSEIISSDISSLLLGLGPEEKASSANSNVAAGAKGSNTGAAGATFRANTQSSHIFSVMLAGTSYRAYVVPVPMVPQSGSKQLGESGDRARVVLCGLLRQSRFHTESGSIPGTILTTVGLSVLLIIVATWPLLKFRTMRLTERIPRRAALYYVLSASFTIILMVMLLIHIRFVSYDQETDNNLQDLASAINRNLGIELSRALQVMDSIKVNPKFKTAVKPSEHQPCITNEQSFDAANFQPNALTVLGMEAAPYPYFRRVLEFDDQGFETTEWTVDGGRTPTVRVCDRDYFTGVVHNQLWYLSEKGLGGPRFRVEPLYSRLTGEYLVVIAQPDWDKQVSPPPLRVIAMVTPLLSLLHPVLPPDYGFAVVDDSGKVLFHSDAAKNGRENIFDEVSDSGDLQTAIDTHRRQFLNIEYLGLEHRALATPITAVQDAPWSLVVFSNTSADTVSRVERMLLFTALTLLYFGVLVIPLSLVLELFSHRPLQWVWPSTHRLGAYRHIALSLVLVILVFYALVYSAGPNELLLFSIFVPASSLAVVVWKLQSRDDRIQWIARLTGFLAIVMLGWRMLYDRTGGWAAFLPLGLICCCYYFLSLRAVTAYLKRFKAPSLPNSFSLACFSLLILISGLPCIAFFKLAYDFEERVATQKQQLFTMAALEERENQVLAQYSNIMVSKKAVPLEQDLGKWLFLRRRLEVEKLDLYDTVFRDQRVGRVFSPQRYFPLSSPERVSDAPAAGGSGLLVRLASLNLLHSPGSVTHELAFPAQESSKWVWFEEGPNRIRIQSRYATESRLEAQGSPETVALAKLVDSDPVLTTQILAYDLNVLQPSAFLGSMALGWIILLIGMFLSVRSTLRRMFLLDDEFKDRWPGKTLDEAIGSRGNLILVGLPCSGKTELLKSRSADVDVVDMATINAGTPLSLSPAHKIVVLDHFEHKLDDPKARRLKLETLEDLLFKEGKKVVVITTTDPEFYLEACQDQPGDQPKDKRVGKNEADRWARALGKFSHARMVSRDPVSTPEFNYFLWDSCTWSEKLALHALAQDGWANYKNRRALEHLWNRGVIEIAPMPYINPPQFREFACSAASTRDQKLWATHSTASVWDGLRIMFLVLLVGLVGVLLVFNQHEVLGYFTAGIGVIMPLTKMFADSRVKLPGLIKGTSENA